MLMTLSSHTSPGEMMVLELLDRCSWLGKVVATGLDDGSVYVWDVQDGRKVRQVMLNSLPQGPISCLSWIGEDIDPATSDSSMVMELDNVG
jgi:WD40 repeat protein